MPTLVTEPVVAASPFPSKELIPQDSPLAPFIWVNPARMHGQPCFKGTRVPVQTLFDHLRAGDSYGRFLEGYEGVSTEQVVAVIDLAAKGLLTRFESL